MTQIVPTKQEYQVDPKYLPDKEGTWQYPPEEDGWVKAHDSLRGEIREIKYALAALVERSGQQGLKEWELAVFKKVFDFHVAHITSHHTIEDTLFMPELRKRFKCPVKFEADHEEIIALIEKMKNMTAKLRVGSKVDDLLVEWTTYEALVRPHLKEEEDTALLLMRAYFVQKEIAQLVQKVMKNANKLETGSFIYFTGEKKFRESFMKQEGIPVFVWYLSFCCAHKTYVRRIVRNIDALKHGTEPYRGGFFGWFSGN